MTRGHHLLHLLVAVLDPPYELSLASSIRRLTLEIVARHTGSAE
jgi:hypothetical protein